MNDVLYKLPAASTFEIPEGCLSSSGRLNWQWLKNYTGYLFLIKENEVALVVVPLLAFRGNGSKMGRITILQEHKTEPDVWWVDLDGNGFDGKPLALPIKEPANVISYNKMFSPVHHKRLINDYINSLKQAVQRTKDMISMLEEYRAAHVDVHAMIQDIIE